MLLLVEKNADVNIRNGEGRTAKEVGVEGCDAVKLLAAAERTDLRRKEEALLSAARNGDLTAINTIVIDLLRFYKIIINIKTIIVFITLWNVVNKSLLTY